MRRLAGLVGVLASLAFWAWVPAVAQGQTAALFVQQATTQVTPVAPGATFDFTFEVNNEGPDSAAAVELADLLPTELLFEALVAPGGWSCTTPSVGQTGSVNCLVASLGLGTEFFTLTVRVDPATVAGTLITNTVTVESTTPDPSVEDNASSSTVVVGSGPPTGSLLVTLVDAPDPVAGGILTYVATATTDLTDASQARFALPVPGSTTFAAVTAPAGFSCASPPVGGIGNVLCTAPSLVGSAVLTVEVLLDPNVTPGSVINGFASITVESDGRDVVGSGASTTDVVAPPLLVTKTVGDLGQGFRVGSLVEYVVRLENFSSLSQLDNPGHELVDVLPPSLELQSVGQTGPGTVTSDFPTNSVFWDGPLAPSQSVELSVVARIRPTVAAGATITNQATVAFDPAESGTNSGVGLSDDPSAPGPADPTLFVAQAGLPTLAVTKTVAGAFEVGGTVTYTVILRNDSFLVQANNAGDELIDILPPELGLIGVSLTGPGAATANLATNTVAWNGTLQPSESATLEISAEILPVANGTLISNQATAHYDPAESGTNSVSTSSDDPNTTPPNDPTVFIALGSVVVVPTLEGPALLVFAILLLGIGLVLGRVR